MAKRVFETAAIKFVPDFTGFKADVKAQLKIISDDPTVRVKVKVVPDMTGFKTKLKAELRTVSNDPNIKMKVKVVPDLTGFKTALQAGIRTADPTIKVKLNPNFAGLQARLNAESRIRDLHINVRINPTGIGALGRLGIPGGGSGGGGGGGGSGGGGGPNPFGRGARGARGSLGNFRPLGGIIDFGAPGLRPMQALIAAGLALAPVLVAVSSSAILASSSIAAIGPASLGAVTAVGAVAGALTGPLTALKAFTTYQKTGGIAAAKQYVEAVNKLSPAGRNFLATLIDMKKGTEDFRRALETAVLPGFINFLIGLRDEGQSGVSVIGIMKQATLDMGEAISDTSARLGKFVSSDFFKDKLATIVHNNQTSFESLNNAVVNLAAPLTSIFAAASPLLVRFGDYLDRVTLRFNTWISGLESSGALQQWFTDAGNELAKWWAIAGNIFGILSNIFSASLPTGQGLVGRFQEFTAAIKEYTSVGGKWRDDIEGFFNFFKNIDYGKLFKTVGQIAFLLATFGAFKFAAKHPLFALFAVLAAKYPSETAAIINTIATSVGSMIKFAADHPTAVKLLLLLFAAFKISMMIKMWGAAGSASGGAFAIAFNFVTAGTMGKFTALASRFAPIFTALGAGAGTVFGIAFVAAVWLGVAAIGLAIGALIVTGIKAALKHFFDFDLTESISNALSGIGKDGLTHEERAAYSPTAPVKPKFTERELNDPLNSRARTEMRNYEKDLKAWQDSPMRINERNRLLPPRGVNPAQPTGPIRNNSAAAVYGGGGAYIGGTFVKGSAAIARAKAEMPPALNKLGDPIDDAMKETQKQAVNDWKLAKTELDNTIRQGKENIAAATRSLTEARQRGAENIAAARREVANADRDALRAQKELTDARVEAAARIKELKQDLLDLKDAEDGHRISLRESMLAQSDLLKNQADARAQAKADVVTMQRQFGASPSDLNAFNLAKAQAGVKAANGPEAAIARDKAALKVREDQNALKSDALKRKEIQAELAKGIEGSDIVVQALSRVADADRNIADAHRTLNKAIRDGARDVADATADLTKARNDNAIAVEADRLKVVDLKKTMDDLTFAIKAVPSKAEVEVAIKKGPAAIAELERVFGLGKGGLGYWIDFYGITLPDKPKPVKRSPTQAEAHSTGALAVRGSATGGYLDGPGTKTSDSIPLWASKGEFVQQAKAVDYYGVDFMKDLNDRKVPKLAGGGSIDEIIAAGKKLGIPLGQITTNPAGYHGAAHSRTGGYHDISRAVDFGGEPGVGGPNTKKIAQYFMQTYGKDLLEEIYTASGPPYKGYYIQNGKVVSPYAASAHKDHVHIAANIGFSGAGFSGIAGPGAGGAGFSEGTLSQAIAKVVVPKDKSGTALGQVTASALTGLFKALKTTPQGGTGDVTGIGGSPSANERLGRQMAAARGWTGSQANALDRLWTRESGWRNTAQNPTSTAYGIAQFLNGTWAGVGATKTSDARKQIQAGLDYIAQRYKTPAGAWAHSQRTGWYSGGGEVVADRGAMLPPHSSTMVHNNTGRSEHVGFEGGTVELGPKTIARLVQALQSRPAELSVNGEVIARHVNDELGHILTVPGVI